MACINSDGSLALVARDVLKALDQARSVDEIRDVSRQPVYRVRASLREMVEMGWLPKRATATPSRRLAERNWAASPADPE